MRRLVDTEVRKLATLRTTWALTAIGLALVAMSAGSYIFGDAIDAPVGSAQRTATAIDLIGTNTMLVLVVGVLVMTTEFRHATIGHTLQLTPSRTRVLTAKLAAGGLYAAGFFAASTVLVAGLVLLAAGLDGAPLAVDGEIATALWHNLTAMVLTGLLGVAVGALVRSQVVAITGSLAWMFIVENLAAAIDYRIGRWFPFQALNAIFISQDALAADPGSVVPLAPALGLTFFIGYVLLTTAGAGILMTRRDI
jgi:ABC-2 type transport system permease protein